jgi:hypothetical protein
MEGGAMLSKLKSTILMHDGKGQRYRIQVIEQIIDPGHLGSSAQMTGMPQLQTESGQAVTPIGNGKYRIVATNEVLTADDPSQQ